MPHLHHQTETNVRTKSSSKLFIHKQKVVEGMPQGMVFDGISNSGVNHVIRERFRCEMTEASHSDKIKKVKTLKVDSF